MLFVTSLPSIAYRDSTFSTLARHVATPLAAEGLALREALLKCRDLSLPKIRCESDSAILVKAINSNTPLVGLYGILADISSIASSLNPSHLTGSRVRETPLQMDWQRMYYLLNLPFWLMPNLVQVGLI